MRIHRAAVAALFTAALAAFPAMASAEILVVRAGRLLDADGGLVTRCRIDDARKEIACAWPSG